MESYTFWCRPKSSPVTSTGPVITYLTGNSKQLYTCSQRKGPAFLDFFSNASSDDILLDQLQSEQGARFLRKRNRNILVKLKEDIPIPSNFLWLTLGQIKALMSLDNVVNMDSRTVVSGISFGSSTIDSAQTIKLGLGPKTQ